MKCETITELHVRDVVIKPTIFSRDLAAVRFYFKAPFGAATIQGRVDFECSVYRDQHSRVYAASVISLFVCTYNDHAHTHIAIDPLP